MEGNLKRKTLYVCRKCGSRFSRKSSLCHHQVNEHKKSVRCRICSKEVGPGGPLTNHLRTHTHSATLSAARQAKKKLLYNQNRKWKKDFSKFKARKLLKCNVCWRMFLHNGALFNHMKTHGDVKTTNKSPLKPVDTSSPAKVQSRVKLYTCRICQRNFETASARSNHYRWHKSRSSKVAGKSYYAIKFRDVYKCSKCGLNFAAKRGVSSHIRTHIRSEKNSASVPRRRFKCKYCSVNFVTLRSFRSHVKDRSSKVRRKDCDKICVARPHVRAQVKNTPKCQVSVESRRSAENVKSEMTKCHFCGLQCKSRQGLSLHSRNHVTEKGSYKCLECNLEFRSSHGLLIHSRKMHVSGQTDCVCTKCGLECKSSHGLSLHSRWHNTESSTNSLHPNDLKEHSSKRNKRKDCDKRYVTRPNLRDQVKNKPQLRVSAKTEMAKCRLCGMQCKSNQGLAIHSRSHVTEKGAYKCFECNSEFVSSHGLLIHTGRMHAISEKVDHVCAECGLECKSSHGLLLHSRRHDNNENVQPESPISGSSSSKNVYKCAECLCVLISKHGFYKHIMSHSGYGTFKCNKCGLRFTHKPGLRKHVKYHTTSYQFKCNLCTASYPHKAGLAIHKMQHQNVRFGSATCKHCKFVFASDAILARHVRARHSSNQNYKCSLCTSQFKTELHLRYHKKIHNHMNIAKNGEKSAPLALNQVTPTQRYSYKDGACVCELCSKGFGHINSLTYHMRVWHNSFLCGTCRVFVDRQYLQRASTIRLKYICTSCQQKENHSGVHSPAKSRPLQLKNASVTQLVQALVCTLVDREVLISEGWLKMPVPQQLQALVESCGKDPVVKNESYTAEEIMVENIKLLFELAVGETGKNTLIQFKSVEEILLIILAPFGKA